MDCIWASGLKPTELVSDLQAFLAVFERPIFINMIDSILTHSSFNMSGGEKTIEELKKIKEKKE